MRTPTDRQLAILRFHVAFQREHGFPPTARETASHFGWAGPGTADQHLGRLVTKGLVVRSGGLSRGVKLTPLGLEMAGATAPAAQPQAFAAIPEQRCMCGVAHFRPVDALCFSCRRAVSELDRAVGS